MASLSGFKDIADFLISKGADIDAKDVRGSTPLIRASMKGYKDTVELLISKGADVNVKDVQGYTALYWASSTVFRGQGEGEDCAEFLKTHGAKL